MQHQFKNQRIMMMTAAAEILKIIFSRQYPEICTVFFFASPQGTDVDCNTSNYQSPETEQSKLFQTVSKSYRSIHNSKKLCN